MDPTATRNSSSILSCQVLAAIMRTGMELRNAGPGRPPGDDALKTGTELARVPFAARGVCQLSSREARLVMNSQHRPGRRAIPRGLEVIRPDEPTKLWRHCGSATAHAVLCHVCLMAGKSDGKRTLSMQSTSPVSFVFWSVARRRAVVESRAATFARVRLAQRLDPILQAV